MNKKVKEILVCIGFIVLWINIIGFGIIVINGILCLDKKELVYEDELKMAYFEDGYSRGVKSTRLEALGFGVGGYEISNPETGATKWVWIK